MFGLNIDPRNEEANPEPAELKELGVRIARYSFKRRENETEDEAIELYKSKAQALADAGIQSLIILTGESRPSNLAHPDYAQPDKNPPDSTWFSAYIPAMKSLAARIAREFPKGTAIQIWNEPEDGSTAESYRPQISQIVFGAMLKELYPAIKEANQDTVVVAGGLSSGVPKWMEEVIKKQMNGKEPFDALAVHPYGKRASKLADPEDEHITGILVDSLRDYAKITSKPLWITESGTNVTKTNARQAAYLKDVYDRVKDEVPRVKNVIWFCYSDAMKDRFGLVDTNGNRKDAYAMYRDLARKFAGKDGNGGNDNGDGQVKDEDNIQNDDATRFTREELDKARFYVEALARALQDPEEIGALQGYLQGDSPKPSWHDALIALARPPLAERARTDGEESAAAKTTFYVEALARALQDPAAIGALVGALQGDSPNQAWHDTLLQFARPPIADLIPA
jgi:hypothetical protein